MGRKGRGHVTDEVLRWPDTVHTEEPPLINLGDSQPCKLPEVVRIQVSEPDLNICASQPGPQPSCFYSQFLPPPHRSPSPIRLIPAPNFFQSLERPSPPPTSNLTKELVTKNFVLVQRVRKKGVGEGPSWVGDPGKVRP